MGRLRLKPLERQVVAILGASSGIGRAAALSFSRRGAKLVVAARGRQGLNSLVAQIQHEGGQACAVTADTINFTQVRAVAAEAVQRYGRLDTWVHTAAVSIYAGFEETTPEEFKHIVETNLTGQAYGAMAALPHLRRGGGGALIHVSSVEARRALPFQSAYAASKHGIRGFLAALRLELAQSGANISITEVMPSSINTPFFEKARTRLGVKPRPVPPIYHPQLVADAIVYAAEHPTPEIVVGGAGRALIALDAVLPRAADALLSSIAFKGQRTAELKTENAPDNLYRSLDWSGGVEGSFNTEARTTSAYQWLKTRLPVESITIGTTALLLGGALFSAIGRSRRNTRSDRL